MASASDLDLYEVLGISRGASKAEIKKAYHKAALASHPDKVPESERESAEIKFKAVRQAYDILSDDDKRNLYDTHGMAAFEKGAGGGGAEMDMDDLFAQMFGGMNMGGMGGMPNGGRPRGPQRGEDEEQEYEVSLEELYKGKTARFQSEKKVVCGQCKGSGGREKTKPKKCDQCKGSGIIRKMQMIGQGLVTPVSTKCNICNGFGEYYRDKDRCKKCKGARTNKQKKKLELYIPPGWRQGESIRLIGEADQEPNQEPGDIIFHIKEKDHDTFIRAGADLSADLNISLVEALTGFDRVVLKHLDGRGIRLKNDPKRKILRPEQIVKVRGEGMPIKKSEAKGDLYLCVKIKFPDDSFFKDAGKLEDLRRLLPKPEPPIRADEEDEVDIEEANIQEFGSGYGDPRAAEAGWEDDEGPQAQCAQQ